MKKRLSKWTVVAAVLALSAGLLTACSSAGNTSEPPAASAGTADIPVRESTASDTMPDTQTDAKETAAVPDTGDTQTVRVMALKGPTAMGMVKLMDEAEAGAVNGNTYEITIAASADEVTPKLIQGEADIAAVPANLASVLYNNTQGKIQVLAINTLGVLYIVENGDTIRSAADLKGRTIYASGKGSTPEYALNYILEENGIDPEKDVTIEWKSEHSECVAALAADSEAIAMLPQPFVTTAQIKNDKIRIALDLSKEWEQSSGTLITGVVAVRADFAAQHPDAVNAFLDSYKSSVDYVNGDYEAASALIEKYDIVPAAVAVKALPYCNITFIEGADLKTRLSGYLDVLMKQNPKAVGGSLPADDFYYSR